MDKELEKKFKEVADMIISNAVWEAGVEELFANKDMTEAQALDAIRNVGIGALIEKATWGIEGPTENGYDEWLKWKIKPEELPRYISAALFADAFKHQLTTMYNKDKAANEAKNKG